MVGWEFAIAGIGLLFFLVVAISRLTSACLNRKAGLMFPPVPPGRQARRACRRRPVATRARAAPDRQRRRASTGRSCDLVDDRSPWPLPVPGGIAAQTSMVTFVTAVRTILFAFQDNAASACRDTGFSSTGKTAGRYGGRGQRVLPVWSTGSARLRCGRSDPAGRRALREGRNPTDRGALPGNASARRQL